jgi:hypothetical protein
LFDVYLKSTTSGCIDIVYDDTNKRTHLIWSATFAKLIVAGSSFVTLNVLCHYASLLNICCAVATGLAPPYKYELNSAGSYGVISPFDVASEGADIATGVGFGGLKSIALASGDVPKGLVLSIFGAIGLFIWFIFERIPGIENPEFAKLLIILVFVPF